MGDEEGEVVLALGMGVTNAAVFKLVPQEVSQAVGGAAGWVGGIGAFGGFVIPPCMSLFVQRFGNSGYAGGFSIFLFFVVISVGLIFALKRGPRRPSLRRVENEFKEIRYEIYNT